MANLNRSIHRAEQSRFRAGRLGHMVKRAHIAPSELSTAAPTAFHPPPTWSANEIECRVLPKLPYTNLTPTLATTLRHTMTAEGQNRAVVLRKVNVLAAAQTDVSSASRMVSVIEQPVLGRGILQLFHFMAGLERRPVFLARWRAPGSNRRRPWKGTGAGGWRAFRGGYTRLVSTRHRRDIDPTRHDYS